jgi:methylenetetrahydrofolate dehydrogenase (NADP+)/methenyltetrahydrofolate cyclohydrolase
MKVSGKPLTDSLLNALKLEIQEDNLSPGLAIILANNTGASRLYVENKLNRAAELGIQANLYQFDESQEDEAKAKIEELNQDSRFSGIIIQFPVYGSWNFDQLFQSVSSQKDVDGFKADSPFIPATAAGVWEMLSEFARLDGEQSAKDFLNGKIITVLGRGKTAGKPTRELLMKKGYEVNLIHSQTPDPDGIIKSSDIIISATGKKHIINGSNIKSGSYVIGVGVGKEDEKTIGDLAEGEIAEIAKLYCPTIGGIGPLTIACLLRNVVASAKRN